MADTRQIIRATREITVNIHGETYDALLIPRQSLVEVDFSQFPEDDPLRRQRNVQVFTELDLDLGQDVINPFTGKHVFRLTKAGAQRLLESL
jgi:hypothetical protein